MFKDMGRITMIKAGRLGEVLYLRPIAAEVCFEGKMDGQGLLLMADSPGPLPVCCIRGYALARFRYPEEAQHALC